MVELVLDTGKHYSNHFLGVIKKNRQGPQRLPEPKKTLKLVQNMSFN
jgi:hypothetical protein